MGYTLDVNPSELDKHNRNLRDTALGGPGQAIMKVLGWTSKKKTGPHS